jgi:hypothetical protein
MRAVAVRVADNSESVTGELLVVGENFEHPTHEIPVATIVAKAVTRLRTRVLLISHEAALAFA